MYLDDKQITGFLGTGENNSKGENLNDFLEQYNPNRYQNPSNTVDTLVFTYTETGGVKSISRVLLIKRGNHPSIGWWALPGGFVEYRENLDTAALRELFEETGINDIDVCQLKCYGDYDRDPRTRIITTAYVALVPEGSLTAQAGDDASDSGWFEIKDELAEEYQNGDYKVSIHRLTLSCPENAVTTSTDIEIRKRVTGILPQVNYKVKATDMLAADHGAIILEGFHFVKGILNK